MLTQKFYEPHKITRGERINDFKHNNIMTAINNWLRY